ncbi:MBL fold metallo-hydrolase [Clostridium paraputrificum]|uniref:MBL fold metallo-hydrolase n=1 Tax=Clostridium paraputrificum TaxID=29363 RepID=UPI003D32B67F
MKLQLLGNCTVLLTTKTTKIILDPYFSNKGNLIYKRSKPVSQAYKNIETLDGILLSHEHFDHIDINFIKKFKDKCPLYAPTLSFIPLLLKRKPAKLGTTFEIKDISITVVQARHMVPTVGYIIQAEGKTIYFAGDTHYGAFMKDIASKFSIHIAILPITNYFPPMTMGKEGILKALNVLKPKYFIPMHKDIVQIFKSGDSTISKEELEMLIKDSNLNTDLIYLENGETFDDIDN